MVGGRLRKVDLIGAAVYRLPCSLVHRSLRYIQQHIIRPKEAPSKW